MLSFFTDSNRKVYAVASASALSATDTERLSWLFGDAKTTGATSLSGTFIGPRREMITPWSTNAVEITQNMGIEGIIRIEEFFPVEPDATFDPMLKKKYNGLDSKVFEVNKKPEPVKVIDDLKAYNEQEGLALSGEEIAYLERLSKKLGRGLTDSEVFGFSQVNSEHCRHKIFNGTFIIDGEEKPFSLFKMIRRTSQENSELLVSAYKDNVAFIEGPSAVQFAPEKGDFPSQYEQKEIQTVISMKAETHNFPTTVEPFNGAATGSGGEIRDRLAGGTGSLPLAGTAVYMTSYSRLEEGREWEKDMQERPWLYQSPMDILIKASNGASDFGNKFGQPLISGSVLTFEHEEDGRKLGFDKVIMLAGGVGFAKAEDALKKEPKKGDKVIVMGGDNYRIGMGGAAVSSVDNGQYESAVELNAVQRSNPEMQKRVANAIRAMVESGANPVVSMHDHGAGGHLNCLSELVENTGGAIDMDKLPVGDPTLSAKEIVGNESQERMGLVIEPKDVGLLQRIAERERAPMYVVGECTGDMQFRFKSEKTSETPIDLQIEDMFGKAPKTVMEDKTIERKYQDVAYDKSKIEQYLEAVLQLEAVACKDWLTNKVDRCVSGRVARQQTVGQLQLPLSDVGVVALDYRGKGGIATSIGHAPVSAIIDPVAGSRASVAESLTNIVFAPLRHGLKGVSLSANWMWPCKNEGEDARLYSAVEALSGFAIELGINVPTGKDSLSMTQKYKNGERVIAPGTVIVSASAEVDDVKKTVTPNIVLNEQYPLVYIDFSKEEKKLGGSSFAQVLKKLGVSAPGVCDAKYFTNAFNAVQELVKAKMVVAGHDISAGGIITTLLEMCFPTVGAGAKIDLSGLGEADSVKTLFAENSGVVLQVKDLKKAGNILSQYNVRAVNLGAPCSCANLEVVNGEDTFSFDVDKLREVWYKTSYLLDSKQTAAGKAKERYTNYAKQPLSYAFPSDFSGTLHEMGLDATRTGKSGIKAAIIREKGSNSEREMANALYLAGFDVKDVHMTDLMSGREDLSDVNFIAAVGGFANSDVLGSAKGWAGAFKYNDKAREALENFYKRPDTLSLGVCNGCQLFIELGLINPEHADKPKMLHNDSHKHECNFINVDIPQNKSVMFGSLSGARLGVWVSHGEGKFHLPYEESRYNIVAKYSYEGYPANPNGSAFNTAAMASDDGRHLVMMPHLERSTFPWNWAYYDASRADQVTPWIEAFVNARKWVETQYLRR